MVSLGTLCSGGQFSPMCWPLLSDSDNSAEQLKSGHLPRAGWRSSSIPPCAQPRSGLRGELGLPIAPAMGTNNAPSRRAGKQSIASPLATPRFQDKFGALTNQVRSLGAARGCPHHFGPSFLRWAPVCMSGPCSGHCSLLKTHPGLSR